MIEPLPEERIHVGRGELMRRVRVNDVEVYCLARKKGRALLWTADVGAARAAKIPAGNKGDFVGWVSDEGLTFLPVEP